MYSESYLLIEATLEKELFEQLFVDGIQLVAKIRKNTKDTLMYICDQITPRIRTAIERVNDILKNACQIEHKGH